MLELITARRPIQWGKYIVKLVKGAIHKTKGFYGLEEVLDTSIDRMRLKKKFSGQVNFSLCD